MMTGIVGRFFRERTLLGSIVVLVLLGLYLCLVFLAIEWAMIRRHPPPPTASQSHVTFLAMDARDPIWVYKVHVVNSRRQTL